MTVRVERVVTVPADPNRVWSFIADPANRARAISVVEDFEIDGDSAVWHVGLPIPVIDRTAAVETEERVREPPTRVEFVGRSRVMRVSGEHLLEEVDGETRLTNRFVVDGRLPGVERYFRKHLDEELDNLMDALAADLGLEPGDLS
ncbi:SRPBCC family protein [Halobacteriales archaeon Cl-PHB]